MALTALAATTAAFVQVAGFDEPGDVAIVEALVRAIRSPEGFERLMSLETFPQTVAAGAARGTGSGQADRDAPGGGATGSAAARRGAAGGAAMDARATPVAPHRLADDHRASDFFVFADDHCLDRLTAASRFFCAPGGGFLATIPDWA
ncbi:MAG TPA: hypothetical protein VF453_03880 [Burkholderiaceae bacterium]